MAVQCGVGHAVQKGGERASAAGLPLRPLRLCVRFWNRTRERMLSRRGAGVAENEEAPGFELWLSRPDAPVVSPAVGVSLEPLRSRRDADFRSDPVHDLVHHDLVILLCLTNG